MQQILVVRLVATLSLIQVAALATTASSSAVVGWMVKAVGK